MKEIRNIVIVGNYSFIQGLPRDCIVCHNAQMGTVLVDGVCLDCGDILYTRKAQIVGMLTLMCDPENQPHQFVDDWEWAYDEMFFK